MARAVNLDDVIGDVPASMKKGSVPKMRNRKRGRGRRRSKRY